MLIKQLPLSAKAFFSSHYAKEFKEDLIIIARDEEEAEKLYWQMHFYYSNKNEIIYFGNLKNKYYYNNLEPNINNFSLLIENRRKILIIEYKNLRLKLPSYNDIKASTIKLKNNISLSREELIKLFIKAGFFRVNNITKPYDFTAKGEIIELKIKEYIYRFIFSWNKLKKILLCDINTTNINQKENLYNENKLKNDSFFQIDEISIFSLIHFLNKTSLSQELSSFTTNLRENFINIKNIENEKIIQSIENNFIQNSFFLAFLSNNLVPIWDYFKQKQLVIIIDDLSMRLFNGNSLLENEIEKFLSFMSNNFNAKLDNDFLSLKEILLNKLLLDNSQITKFLQQNNNIMLNSTNLENINIFQNKTNISYKNNNQSAVINNYIESNIDNSITKQNLLIEDLIELTKIKQNILVHYQNNNALKRLIEIFKKNSVSYCLINNISELKSNIVNFVKLPLDSSFIFDSYLCISEIDIFGKKYFTDNKTTSSSKKKLQNILAELDNLKEGDLIVHKNYGIGKFLNLESINIQNTSHDCLKILYADNNKLYVPVENIEIIKKFGEAETALDKLGSASFQKRKAAVKKLIDEIAQKLIELTAKRKLLKIEPIDYDKNLFEEFCDNFGHVETEDQLNAIEDIVQDFSADYLMDRLLCGDVGFGKTEVALRAINMILTAKNHQNAQVAFICPTTILAKQHYMRCKERFKNASYAKIANLSRLVSSKDAKKIKEEIRQGKINLVIGTHALLADNINFNNLKLLVIDEEQHFGTMQKEKLKSLKSNVHVLSLSATPIPRTLQMSLVGIKDLSIIASPPQGRQEVVTKTLVFDRNIIATALREEKKRNGQSFYVSPRIEDIEEIEKRLKIMVPELKYKIAYGKMPAKMIDQIIEEFYEKKIDVLISTNIIESGIDIPNANTIIIHKANFFGLSQLYQLRGRIGRGKNKGYAYLTIEANQQVKANSLTKLEIIENASKLGSGFTIASHDMDLRGFGNLVGHQQSGHIKEVGVELYQEMLEEAMNEINKSDKKTEGELSDKNTESFSPKINLGISVFIPDSYVKDINLKLGIYKRVGLLMNEKDIASFREEMISRFGEIPDNFNNLLEIIKIKHLCIKLSIESLEASNKGFLLQFRQDKTEYYPALLNLIAKKGEKVKYKENNKLFFFHEIHTNITESAINFLQILLTEINN